MILAARESRDLVGRALWPAIFPELVRWEGPGFTARRSAWREGGF